MTRLVVGAAVVAALSVALTTTAHAGPIVYSNLGPGGTFNPSSGLAVSDLFGNVFSEATEFFPSADYVLESISVALRSGLNEFDLITLSLIQGSDPLTGTVVESFALDDVTTTPQLYTLSSITRPQLVSGQQYWLMLAPANTNAESTAATWLENVIFAGEFTGGLSTLTYVNGSLVNSHFFQPAFEVRGEPAVVPEPTTMMLVGSGIAALLTRRCRRRRADTSPITVPVTSPRF